jgi:hypothetical protein
MAKALPALRREVERAWVLGHRESGKREVEAAAEAATATKGARLLGGTLRGHFYYEYC